MDLSPDQTLARLVAQVRDTMSEGYENIVPYTRLAAALNPDFAACRPWPGIHLYDAWLRGRVFEENRSSTSASFGETTVKLFRVRSSPASRTVTEPEHKDAYTRYYLPSLYLNDAYGQSSYLEYNRAVFTSQTAQKLIEQQNMMIGLLSTPGMSLSEAWAALDRHAVPDPSQPLRTIIR